MALGCAVLIEQVRQAFEREGVTELQVSVSMDAGRCAGGIAADGLCSALETKPGGVGTRAGCYRAPSVNWL